MNFTYFLKEPKGNKPSLILYSCYFKFESKKFVYSTGEKIHPKNWDFENRHPIKRGKLKASDTSSISVQLNSMRRHLKKLKLSVKKRKRNLLQ